MKAERWQCTNEEYHASPGTSHSQLEVFIQNPKAFYQHFVMQPPKPRKQTEDRLFGQRVHAHNLERGCVQIPESALARNGAKSGKAWRDFAALHEGKLLLKEHEYLPVVATETAIRENEKATWLVYDSEGENEVSIRWIDNATGMLLRVRLDRVINPLKPEIIIDLKAVRSAAPEKFASFVEEFGYHRQAAMYQDAVSEHWGVDAPFVFVAIDKDEPMYTACYELEPSWVERGREENRRALERLKQAIEQNNWRPATSQQITRLQPPGWAARRTEYAL
jgi:hypothetical protein